MMKKEIVIKTLSFIFVGLLSTQIIAKAESLPNTQVNSDFIQKTRDKSSEQLADMVYQQAMNQWHDKFIDRCTKIQVSVLGSQVIFDNLLMDDLCGGQIRSSDIDTIQAHIQSGKLFRVNEIKKTPTAMFMIDQGVVQVYRFYLMPEKRLIGEFSVDKKDIQ